MQDQFGSMIFQYLPLLEMIDDDRQMQIMLLLKTEKLVGVIQFYLKLPTEAEADKHHCSLEFSEGFSFNGKLNYPKDDD